MKRKQNSAQRTDELRAEYDLSELGPPVKGKYAKRYKAGTNIAVLSPEVAKAFPTDEA